MEIGLGSKSQTDPLQKQILFKTEAILKCSGKAILQKFQKTSREPSVAESSYGFSRIVLLLLSKVRFYLKNI